MKRILSVAAVWVMLAIALCTCGDDGTADNNSNNTNTPIDAGIDFDASACEVDNDCVGSGEVCNSDGQCVTRNSFM